VPHAPTTCTTTRPDVAPSTCVVAVSRSLEHAQHLLLVVSHLLRVCLFFDTVPFENYSYSNAITVSCSNRVDYEIIFHDKHENFEHMRLKTHVSNLCTIPSNKNSILPMKLLGRGERRERVSRCECCFFCSRLQMRKRVQV
jgi:hypothetical protein